VVSLHLRTLAREGRMTVTIGRRELLAALGGAAAWPLVARAQQAPCVIVRDQRPGPSDQAVGKVWLARTAIPTPQIATPMRRGVGAILEVPCRRTISAVAVASKV
jgi:hypothetical protein